MCDVTWSTLSRVDFKTLKKRKTQRRKKEYRVGQRSALQRTRTHIKNQNPSQPKNAGTCRDLPGLPRLESVFSHLLGKQDAVCPPCIFTVVHLLSFPGLFAMGYVHHRYDLCGRSQPCSLGTSLSGPDGLLKSWTPYPSINAF